MFLGLSFTDFGEKLYSEKTNEKVTSVFNKSLNRKVIVNYRFIHQTLAQSESKTLECFTGCFTRQRVVPMTEMNETPFVLHNTG